MSPAASSARAIVAVLAGGAGSRLGQSKPLAELGGVPLLEHAVAAARESGLPTIVVAKGATRVPALDAGIVVEPDQPVHPLVGAVAALRFAAGVDVVTLPCDMPFVPPALLSLLASLEGAATVEHVSGPQPLLSRLPASSRPSLERALAAGASAQAAIAALAPRIIGPRELTSFGDPERVFFNVNTREELRRAEEWLAAPAG